MTWLPETATSVVDALTSSICVIDHEGVIRAENSAWHLFSSRNGGRTSYIGANYVDVCLNANAMGSEGAKQFGEAIKQVLDGTLQRFESEYPCHSLDEQRWFVGRVTPLQSPDGVQCNKPVGAVVSHQDVTDKKILELKLERLAGTDDLTGLNNRRSIIHHIGSASQWRKPGYILALFLLDMDNFKEINDVSGHDAGDLVIKQVAERISSLTVQFQSVLAARMGGDEFAFVLEVQQPWGVVPVAEKLLSTLSKPYLIDGEAVESAASVGIAFYPKDAATPQSLLKAADLALYKAKDSGRNRYVFYTENLREAAQKRKALFREAKSGILCNQFETYFQPIVLLKDKSLLGFEALVRWQHPERGLLTPSHFLAALRDRNLGEALSQAVLLQVIQHLSEWPSVRVSVNLTSGQLQNPNFVEFLSRQISSHAIRPDQLKLEITEDVVIGGSGRELSAVLARLRDTGFRISLDDFGTGYASLSHLSQFPLDEIKIDMSFVRQLNVSRSSRSVVRAITHLAHELGLSVVAEGIEDTAIEGIVTALGCDCGQGYLFGRPQPASSVPNIINEWAYSSRATSALPAPNLRSSSK